MGLARLETPQKGVQKGGGRGQKSWFFFLAGNHSKWKGLLCLMIIPGSNWLKSVQIGSNGEREWWGRGQNIEFYVKYSYEITFVRDYIESQECYTTVLDVWKRMCLQNNLSWHETGICCNNNSQCLHSIMLRFCITVYKTPSEVYSVYSEAAQTQISIRICFEIVWCVFPIVQKHFKERKIYL